MTNFRLRHKKRSKIDWRSPFHLPKSWPSHTMASLQKRLYPPNSLFALLCCFKVTPKRRACTKRHSSTALCSSKISPAAKNKRAAAALHTHKCLHQSLGILLSDQRWCIWLTGAVANALWSPSENAYGDTVFLPASTRVSGTASSCLLPWPLPYHTHPHAHINRSLT